MPICTADMFGSPRRGFAPPGPRLLAILKRHDAAVQLSGSFQRVSLFRASRRTTESEPKDFAT
jgi:hypothetical protein